MNFDTFVYELNTFLNETGMSKRALASMAKVPQSQVSDWSNGNGVRFTPNAKKVLNTIVNYRTSSEPLPDNVEKAIRDVWKGDQKRADVIANVIHSLQPIFDEEIKE